MTAWTEVVTHPLGLAGFALFLVFAFLAKIKRRDERRWLIPFSLAMAMIALLAGLALAYWQSREPGTPVGVQPSAATPSPIQPQPSIQQETHGDASPAVADVEGNVTITITPPDKQKREEKKDEKEKK